jgi:hypothetical protein
MNQNYHVAFLLGAKAAEIAHGVTMKGRRSKSPTRSTERSGKLRKGSSTLLQTPEETAADVPPVPPELAPAMPELDEQIRRKVVDAARKNRHEAMNAERQMPQFIVNEWKSLGLKRPT